MKKMIKVLQRAKLWKKFASNGLAGLYCNSNHSDHALILLLDVLPLAL